MVPLPGPVRPLLSDTCHSTSMMSRRASSDIIGCDEEHVIKLYSSQTPRAAIEDEVFYIKVAREHGLRVPEVMAIIRDDDRWGYSYRLVQGATLLHESLYGNRETILEASMVLASAHWMVHGHYDDRLPPIKARMVSSIEASSEISEHLRDAALGSLRDLPNGHSICHGDLHPENVIMTPEGPTLLDWVDAGVGDPLADMVRTCILLEIWLPIKVIELDLGISRERLGQMYEGYRRSYLELSGASEDAVQRWLLSVATARLSQGVPGEGKRLMKIIDNLL